MGMLSTQVCNSGVVNTQRRALAIARRLAALASSPLHDAPGLALVAGRARALSMYLGNDTLSAAEALAAGIVHEVSKPIKP